MLHNAIRTPRGIAAAGMPTAQAASKAPIAINRFIGNPSATYCADSICSRDTKNTLSAVRVMVSRFVDDAGIVSGVVPFSRS